VGHGAAVALIDERGTLLAAPDYEDPAFEAVAADYRALRDAFALTLSPKLPLGLNLGRQLSYLQTREPGLFGSTAHLLLHPQYWAWKLSDTRASEITSLGCHTDLWQPRAAAPSPLARARGWDRLLPPLRRADAVLGTISEAVRTRTGLPAQCHVRCGIHDSNASWLAHLAHMPQGEAFSVISSGTWVILMAREYRPRAARRAARHARQCRCRGLRCDGALHGRPRCAAIAGERAPPAALADLRAVLHSGALALPVSPRRAGPSRAVAAPCRAPRRSRPRNARRSPRCTWR
jgi:sugar (pentulose or hexulose) kinase